MFILYLFSGEVVVFKKIFFGLSLLIGLPGFLLAKCLVKEADFRAQTCVGRVHLAAFHGHTKCLKKLLNEDPSLVNETDEYRNTPAHYCVKDLARDKKKQKCLKILLKNKARLDIRNTMRVTALDLAGQFRTRVEFDNIRERMSGKLRSNSCDF